MIRFAVIGTHWITSQFVDAAHQTGRFHLTAVYSRQIETAHQFGQPLGVTLYFDDLLVLAQSPDIDAVYIASPNALHFSQAQLLLTHGKHVICEKPLASNAQQVGALLATAKSRGVVLFEAYKTAHLPNFTIIQQALPRLGRIRKAVLNYCQYSSRYPAYLRGENPNTFNPQFSNGSIMDIGFYCVAFAAALWGQPTRIQATASLLESGVDGHGSVLLDYPTHDCTILHSKVSQSALNSEIQGELGTLSIQSISNCEKVTLILNGEAPQVISEAQNQNTMFYEAHHFANLISNLHRQRDELARTQITADMLTEIRRLTGVVFPADQESEVSI